MSDLIATAPDADVEYVEEFLLQVMNDEFDCNVEDGSGEKIAAKIVGLRKLTLQGDFGMVDEMWRQWQERKARGGSEKVNFQIVDDGDEEDEEDGADSDSEFADGDADDDVEMDEAPSLVKVPREKVQPRVDDEGFTEVVKHKRR